MRLLVTGLPATAYVRQDFTAMTAHCEIVLRTAMVAGSAIIIQVNALVILDTRVLHARKYGVQRIAQVRTNLGSATSRLAAARARLQATVRHASFYSVLVTVPPPPVVNVTVLQDSAVANRADCLQTARAASVGTTLPRSLL